MQHSINAKIVDAITHRGTIVEFLPPTATLKSPIEQKWAEAKAIRCNDIDNLFAKHFEYANL